jgi:uncharacterized protein YggU (UPF0235/DUF167 family)
MLELLSGVLQVGKAAVRLESGATSSRKRVSVPQEALPRLRAM